MSTPASNRAGAPRVLHVAHSVPPHLGGLEAVVAAETCGLRQRGWQATVVSSADSVGPGERVEGGIRTVRVRAWNGLEVRFGVPFPVFSPRLLGVLAREVRRAEIVHIHDVLYVSSWAAALCCLLLRRPYVVHRHVGFVHHGSLLVRVVQQAVLGTLGRGVLTGAAAILAIDEHIAAGLRATVRAPGRVEVLSNGVDATRFRPRPAADIGSGRPTVLFVGRFVPKKGFDVVAAAADDTYELVFAGGERPPGLQDPRLRFLGAVPAAEMPDIYAAADAMVIASVGECPLTVLEAMASGLPVVLREDPALHSVWTAGPGATFVDLSGAPAAAGERLRAELRALSADPAAARAQGAAGASYVVSRFSWEVHLDRLTEIYRRVTSRSLPR